MEQLDVKKHIEDNLKVLPSIDTEFEVPNCYHIKIDDEPEEAYNARKLILDTFKDLVFVENGHHYYLNGEEIISVTNVVKKFENEVDFDLVAERKAIKDGCTKEELLDSWKYINLVSTTTGTMVHEFGESLGWVMNGHPELITESCLPKYYKEKNWLIPTRKKEEAIVKFMKDLPKSYHLVLNEAKVYSGLNKDERLNPKTKFCGTFDMLYYYDGEGDPSKAGFVIFDYKTNSKIESEYNRNNMKCLAEPFINMIDEPQSCYTLQLSAYQIPLEDIGLKIIGRRLIWLKDDGTYEKIPLIDVSRTLRDVL